MSVDHGTMDWFTGEKPIADAAPSDTVVMVSGDTVETARRTATIAGPDYDAYTVTAFPLPPSAAAMVSGPSPLLGADPNRKSVTILNAGTDPVVFGKLSQVSSGSGFTLLGGASITVEVSAAVWVCTAPGFATTNLVSVLAVYARD